MPEHSEHDKAQLRAARHALTAAQRALEDAVYHLAGVGSPLHPDAVRAIENAQQATNAAMNYTRPRRAGRTGLGGGPLLGA